MSPFYSLQERDIELLRDIREAGDFISTWSFGEELAGPSPERFFHGEEALPLDECTFDLPVVDGGVDGAADVHFYVSAQDGMVAC